ncbi:MAG: CoA-binding protein [Dongiaceae bacterium]
MEGAIALRRSAMPNHDSYSDDQIRRVLDSVRTIAMVGASPDWNRASSFAMKYLQDKGYRIIPVNPRAADRRIFGETCYRSLTDIPRAETGPVDMVDIFRRPEFVREIVDEAIAVGAKIVWMQLGIRDDDAAERAEFAGLTVIMNRCPKIEYGRLHGELSWGGFNSGIISSKRRRLERP